MASDSDSHADPHADSYFRRIRPEDVYFDPQLGRERPQTGCFCDDSIEGGMSTYSQRLLSAIGKVPADVLARYPDHRLIEIPGSLLVKSGQTISVVEGDDPLDECREAHVEVLGPKGKPLQKALRVIPFFET